MISGTVFDSGWVGYANYSGPWGSSVNNSGDIFDSFDYGSTSGRQLRVLAGAAGTDGLTDAVNVTITCGYDTDLEITNVYDGDTATDACTRNSPGTTVFTSAFYFNNSDWTQATEVYYNSNRSAHLGPRYLSKDDTWRYWNGTSFGASGSCSSTISPHSNITY